jgi:hypothetical protein
MREFTAGFFGLLIAAVAAYVAFGMIKGAIPNFSKGVSSSGSILVQELAGALTLASLAVAAVGLVRFVQRNEQVACWSCYLLASF